jgi:hypothetical protein
LDKDLTFWHERFSWAVKRPAPRTISDLDSAAVASPSSSSSTRPSPEHQRPKQPRTTTAPASGRPHRDARHQPPLAKLCRVGFVHQYRELGPTEQAQMISEERPLPARPGTADPGPDHRINSGTSAHRRLMAQIERILDHDLDTVTADVVAARETLVIGIA